MDLVEPTSLEESNIKSGESSADDKPSTVHVSSKQMTQISRVHQKLYKHLVETEWYRPVVMEALKISDWIQPLLHSYTAATLLSSKLADMLGELFAYLEISHSKSL